MGHRRLGLSGSLGTCPWIRCREGCSWAEITGLTSLPKASSHYPRTAGQGTTQRKGQPNGQNWMDSMQVSRTSLSLALFVTSALVMGTVGWGRGADFSWSNSLICPGEELGPSASSLAPTHGKAPKGSCHPYVTWCRGTHTLDPPHLRATWLVAELCGGGRALSGSSFSVCRWVHS